MILLYAVAAAAQDSPKVQLTARELFYSAASEPAPAAREAPKPAAPAIKKTVTPKKAPTAPTRVDPFPAPPAGQHAQPVALPGGGRIVEASMSTAAAPETGTALGLKYTILKKSGDDMVEVPPDTVFHAGDRIQLSVQTNGPGYLYIVSQGSSGTWKPMFPSAEVADGNNHVDGWSANTLPPKSRMVFDEQTGTEKIFIVFSRHPESGLEDMIYSLQGGGAKIKPAIRKPEDKAAPPHMLQIAQVNIDDATVGHLRDTYARDLIIEKVDEKTPGDKTPGDKKEKAVYVVNPSGSSDSRVVADLKLVHQ